jgi:hypothetical protein
MPVPPRHLFPVRSPWFGLVLFDPYWWEPGIPDQAPLPAAAAPSSDRRPTGGLQLDVEPRCAMVYVDGRLSGSSTSSAATRTRSGRAHRPLGLRLRPSSVDVVVCGRTTTCRLSRTAIVGFVTRSKPRSQSPMMPWRRRLHHQQLLRHRAPRCGSW